MKYLLAIWYCTLTHPICQPAEDPTGPAATYHFGSFLSCEYAFAHVNMTGVDPPGLRALHTCTPDGEPL